MAEAALSGEPDEVGREGRRGDFLEAGLLYPGI